jgi:hypothetical protein
MNYKQPRIPLKRVSPYDPNLFTNKKKLTEFFYAATLAADSFTLALPSNISSSVDFLALPNTDSGMMELWW